jgi:hypothetical protein
MKKMRHCFWCGEEIGILAAIDHDELDTCGRPECEKHARIEAREIEQERRDWDCGGDRR